MQKEKTLQFWDNFYSDSGKVDAKEWIIQPSDALFRCILQWVLPEEADTDQDRTFMVLEIGCGTSLLSDSLCQYWERHGYTRKLHVIATDVSAVCIEKQRTLQAELDQSRCFSSARLEYKTLNITELHSNLTSQLDLILDKGCLDTCLFRSKNTEAWIDHVLQNLHSWLKQNGVYTILTPRSKIKQIRDYPGFDVSRKILSENEFDLGDMEPRSGNKTSNDFSTIQRDSCQYMYICRRRA